jgi:hypothetical protein
MHLAGIGNSSKFRSMYGWCHLAVLNLVAVDHTHVIQCFESTNKPSALQCNRPIACRGTLRPSSHYPTTDRRWEYKLYLQDGDKHFLYRSSIPWDERRESGGGWTPWISWGPSAGCERTALANALFGLELNAGRGTVLHTVNKLAFIRGFCVTCR